MFVLKVQKEKLLIYDYGMDLCYTEIQKQLYKDAIEKVYFYPNYRGCLLEYTVVNRALCLY